MNRLGFDDETVKLIEGRELVIHFVEDDTMQKYSDSETEMDGEGKDGWME